MRLNSNLVLKGARVVLVPYREEHVPLYHTWMSDPWLQEMTASEPLSLEQEFAHCVSWRESEDKLTFIVLESGTADTPGTGSHGGRMVGDVNLFFHSWLQEEEEEEEEEGVKATVGGEAAVETHADAGVASQSAQAQGVHGAGYACAEVDVMIAEPTARRRGLATESLRLLLGYAALELGTRTFVAKIGFANLASQACFCQNFGFVEVCGLLSLWRSSHSHSTGLLVWPRGHNIAGCCGSTSRSKTCLVSRVHHVLLRAQVRLSNHGYCYC
jgi:RimJ/RimL family protein N-acetyltransferase